MSRAHQSFLKLRSNSVLTRNKTREERVSVESSRWSGDFLPNFSFERQQAAEIMPFISVFGVELSECKIFVDLFGPNMTVRSLLELRLLTAMNIKHFYSTTIFVASF